MGYDELYEGGLGLRHGEVCSAVERYCVEFVRAWAVVERGDLVLVQ